MAHQRKVLGESMSRNISLLSGKKDDKNSLFGKIEKKITREQHN